MRSYFPTFLLFRVIAIALYLVGTLFLVLPADELFKVEAVNWTEDFLRKSEQWRHALKQMTALTDESYTSGDDLQKRYDIELTEFIAQRTKDMQIDVTGKEWEGLFTDLAAVQNGKAGDAAWEQTRGYFAASFQPLASIRKNFENDRKFLYVRISDANQRHEHLAISLQGAGDFAFKAPGHIAYPLRHAGCWMMLAGILLYLMNSRPSTNPHQVRLSHAKTSRGPDFFTAIFAPGFVAIGGGAAIGAGLKTFTPEWFVFSSIFWFFALLFASAWLFTAWYRAFTIDYSSQSLVFNNLFGSTEYDMARVSELRPAVYQPPWWMKILLWIGRVSARSRSSRQLYDDKGEPGFVLVMSDGTNSPVVSFSELTGVTQFYAELEARGIHVEEDLALKAAAADRANSAGPGCATRTISKILSLSAVAAAAFGVVSTYSASDVQIRSSSFPEGSAFPVEAERSRPTTEEMLERVRKNDEVMREVNQLNQKIQELSDQFDKTTDPELRQKLTRESNLLLQKMMQLRKQMK